MQTSIKAGLPSCHLIRASPVWSSGTAGQMHLVFSKNVLKEKPKLLMALYPVCLPILGLITKISLSQLIWEHCYFCSRHVVQNTWEAAILTLVLTY